MRVFSLLALAVVLAMSLAACRGGGDSSSQQPLSQRDFKNKVAAAIVTRSDLQAVPGFGMKVDVSEAEGLDTLEVLLDEPYRRYRAAPASQQAVVNGLVDEVVTEIEDGNSKRSFAEVRDQLRPMLKRRSDVEKTQDPAFTRFHDLDVVYAVQREHSFTVVTKDDLEHWGRSLDQIDSIALANLERETNKEEKLRCEPTGGQELCGWASGDGYDATRMLVPGLRHQILEELGGPAVYAVPLESVYVALTRNYASVIRGKVLQEFTTGENPLSPDLFVERDGRLEVLPR
ncbi:MAG TPA: DUF1444 family protein [Gaiellaceae bacterium]|nr:DUF1444 family protein [Gaiellaceae bacterium]